ncbi:MAG: substrate-binding domain-containing protein [Chloroflexi bacterium]|nr:substrate-binding domain-containing protein [Chloroflexota bacterium]
MPKPKRMNQREIADALGVSIITVQRALNNSGYVSPEMRERILAYMQQVNYKPDRAAQILVRNETRTISLFSANRPAFFWDSVSEGITRAAERISMFGYQVRYHRLESARTEDYLQALQVEIDDGVQAVGVVNHEHFDMERVFQLLDTREIPYVTFNIDAPHSRRLCFVGADYRAEGRLVAELFGKFLSAGQKVAVLVYDMTGQSYPHATPISELRLGGFATHLAAEYPQFEHFVVAIPFAAASTEITRQIDDLLERYQGELSAIYCIPPIHAELCSVIEAKGLTNTIKLIAPDLSPEIGTYLTRNLLTLEISQNPMLQGFATVLALARYLETGTKPEPELQYIDHSLVTKVNLDSHNKLTWLTGLGIE